MALPDTPDLFKSLSRPAGRLIPAALVLGALAANEFTGWRQRR